MNDIPTPDAATRILNFIRDIEAAHSAVASGARLPGWKFTNAFTDVLCVQRDIEVEARRLGRDVKAVLAWIERFAERVEHHQDEPIGVIAGWPEAAAELFVLRGAVIDSTVVVQQQVAQERRSPRRPPGGRPGFQIETKPADESNRDWAHRQIQRFVAYNLAEYKRLKNAISDEDLDAEERGQARVEAKKLFGQSALQRLLGLSSKDAICESKAFQNIQSDLDIAQNGNTPSVSKTKWSKALNIPLKRP